jgi:Ca2+-binding RTX toxin-like protein
VTHTHVFAQLVDLERNLVVNNLATPILIELDGQPHAVELDLERIASLSTSAGYQLQIIPQTTVYEAQRATGAVEITDAAIELPLVESASGAGAGGDGGASSSAAAGAGAGTAGSASASGACLNLIRGSKRSEKLRGSEGPDRIKGLGGADRIPALGGDDCIGGGAGSDRIRAGEGADVVQAAKGGRDRVDCGPGVDVAFVKRGRDSWRACEKVHKC